MYIRCSGVAKGGANGQLPVSFGDLPIVTFISLAARYKLCSTPLEAKNIPLGQKRKRGRVAKAKKALIVQ
ncbi:unnamed protein product [Rotaria magnacalcarata]